MLWKFLGCEEGGLYIANDTKFILNDQECFRSKKKILYPQNVNKTYITNGHKFERELDVHGLSYQTQLVSICNLQRFFSKSRSV